MDPALQEWADRWIARGLRHLIGGEFVESASGRRFAVFNPATGEVMGWAAEGGAEEIGLAVAAARSAFAGWSRMRAADRTRILQRWADLILRHKEQFVLLETLDVGRPVRENRVGYIERVAANITFFAELAEKMGNEAYHQHHHYLFYTQRDPVGVAGLITPWNLPLMLSTWKIGPALAAGNTCILKPAELTPVCCTRLAELAVEAGLPPGVFNVVHGFGPDSAGEALTRHPGVDLISFTGESGTGKAIMAAASGNLKRVSFELGGKGTNIVFADADLSQALEVALRAAFTNQGEVCLAGSRIFVQQPVYDRFVADLVQRVGQIRVGDPRAEETDMGPLISPEHWQKVRSYVEIGQAEGAKLLCGGHRPAGLERGNFLAPAVFADAQYKHRICQEEIFGPVVTVTPFRTEEEAVAWTNDTRYGLSAVVCSENIRRAHRVARQIQAGNIWINSWFVRDLRVPFGGFKESGIGREGGLHSFEFFTETKTIGLPLE